MTRALNTMIIQGVRFPRFSLGKWDFVLRAFAGEKLRVFLIITTTFENTGRHKLLYRYMIVFVPPQKTSRQASQRPTAASGINAILPGA